jgi:hypothetical protein
MSTELHPPLPMSFGPTPLDFSVGISTTCSQCIFIRTQDSGRASGTIRNVYDVVHGQHLPDKKIRDTSSQLVVGAWVRFTSPLPRADDAFDSDPWIRRHSTDAPKPKRHGCWLGGDAKVDGTLGVLSHCDAMKTAVVGRRRFKGTAGKMARLHPHRVQQ